MNHVTGWAPVACGMCTGTTSATLRNFAQSIQLILSFMCAKSFLGLLVQVVIYFLYSIRTYKDDREHNDNHIKPFDGCVGWIPY